MDKVDAIVDKLNDAWKNAGLEFHPFKIGWYNSCVQPVFNLPYHKDTVAILVISIPKMFECILKPFVQSDYKIGLRMDPIDQCMQAQFKKMQELLYDYETETILDYELHPTRRPKLLVQTAGHVSGAAYYYQRDSVRNPPWDPDRKIYGVSLHPLYGGWFAFRGVLILKHLLVGDEFKQKDPQNCVSTEDKTIELLERFNGNWKDWSYRDVMDTPVLDRYSEEQKEYFATLPGDRHKLIVKWVEDSKT